MNRIFIIAHAPLAHALREIALHVFPDSATDVVALDVQSGAQPEDTLTQAESMMDELSKTGQKDNKKGVILLCDILGA
jgi:mannose PTS system EIIA component